MVHTPGLRESSQGRQTWKGSDLTGEGIVDHIEWQRNLLVSPVLSPWASGKQASRVQAGWQGCLICGCAVGGGYSVWRLEHRSLPGRPHSQEDTGDEAGGRWPRERREEDASMRAGPGGPMSTPGRALQGL